MANINGDDGDNTIFGTEDSDNIYGRDGNDTLYGYGGDDNLFGEAGNDVMYGGDGNDWFAGWIGNDTIYGEDGDDIMYGEGGDDLLDGGPGFDTVGYGNYENGVIVDLFAGTATGFGNDTLVSIEGVVGSHGNDFIVGNDGDNVIDGYWGDDYIVATLGEDIIDGGQGVDTLDFSQIGFGLEIATNFYTASAPDFTMLFSGIEIVIATDHDDTIFGNSIVIEYFAGAGDDIIQLPAYGNDYSAWGEDGNDLVHAGYGNDYIDGGDGFDVVYFSEGVDVWTGTGYIGITIDLSQQEQINKLGNETQLDTLISIEGAAGSSYSDTLLGNGDANYLSGWYENGWGENHDTIRGQAGDDLIEIGEGSHNLAGNGGQDILQFFANENDTNYGTGFTFSLALQGTEQDTGVGTMLAFGFEHLTGGFDDDHLTGDAGDNQLSGSGGNDMLLGGDGNDILRGDATTHMDETGWHLSLDGVEDNGANNDSLFGGDGDDWLDGEYGDDLLVGGSGMDMLFGGEGEDTLRGNGQKDDLDGGAARDKLYGGAGSDTAHGGEANDVVRGNGGDDNLFGDAGDDRILGGGGQDKIVGGEGNDELSGGNGADTFLFGIDSGTDVITDFTEGDTIEFAAGLGLAYEDLVIDDSLDGAVISWGLGDSILLSGVAAASLDASDFDFGADAMAATLSQIDAGLAG